jgi:cytoskeleton protein RodZ
MGQLSPCRPAASTVLSDPSASPALPELVALGHTLRAARESQGLSVAALAARLNMGCEQLEALENGERKRLREAVFVIAQARRIAGSLGVNVDSQIEALRANPAFSAKAAPKPSPAPPGQAGRRPAASPAPQATPSRRRWNSGTIAASLMAALGLAAGAVGLQRLQKPATASAPTPAASWAPAEAPPASTGPADRSSLVLNARGPSWVEIATTGGTTLFRGTLEGQRSFPLGQGLRVLAGRPDLVTAQLGGGPAQALGRIDQVKWRRFAPGATAPAP